jgi:exopolysaccharide biosynthesis protein
MGMTTEEVADVLLKYGATDAVNLDGGGSTQLIFADPEPRVVNKPSDGKERAVGGNLAVFVPLERR